MAIFLAIVPFFYAEGAPCEGAAYFQAVCQYRQRAWVEAEKGFSEIVDLGHEDEETIKALYFRARTRMQLKRWEEASTDLIRIYTLYPAFFQEWNGDFLLGECRKMLGKD